MKIAPIDIGTAANKILKWKQECYHENGLLFLILFSVCFSILFAFLFTLLKHLAKEYINSLEKDTCTFAISFSVIVQLLLERYTHVIETVSAITCPTTTKVSDYSVLRNWYSYFLHFLNWCIDKILGVLYWIWERINEDREFRAYWIFFLIFYALILLSPIVIGVITGVIKIIKRGISPLDVYIIVIFITLPIFIIQALPAHFIAMVTLSDGLMLELLNIFIMVICYKIFEKILDR